MASVALWIAVLLKSASLPPASLLQALSVKEAKRVETDPRCSNEACLEDLVMKIKTLQVSNGQKRRKNDMEYGRRSMETEKQAWERNNTAGDGKNREAFRTK